MTDRFSRFSDYFETKFSPSEHSFQDWWSLAQEELEDAYTKAKDEDKSKMKDMLAEIWGLAKEDVLRDEVPDRWEDRFNELIDKGYSPTNALKQVGEEREAKERKEREIADYEDRVPSEWRARYRELIAEGRSPEEAYRIVMGEIEEQKRKLEKVVEEVEKRVKELPEEIRVPSERAIVRRINLFEKQISEEPLEREKYERLHKTLERSLTEEYGLG